jgi:PKD repeat protein
MKNIFAWMILLSASAQSQSLHTRWMLNPYDEKVFIENKGQYVNEENKLSTEILFSFEQGNTSFFLCRNEFIVREQRSHVNNSGDEKDDPAKEYDAPIEFEYVRFGFTAADKVSAEGENIYPSPFRYYISDNKGIANTISAHAFKSVIYPNLYPGIDMVFIPHEKNGIEYSYIVHPNADASVIRTVCNGPLQNVNGNIMVTSGDAEVTDHAPDVFYSDNHEKILSAYVISGNSYSFSLDDYDHARAVTIDPWVVNPNFTVQNKAFDIASDSSGNVFVFGGQTPWKLKKFDQNGNLIWTYVTNFNEWYGALAVDPVGNSYISDGCCSGTIQQVNDAGFVGWSVTNGIDEYWRMAFNCDFTQLALSTGYASSAFVLPESVSLLDTATGNITSPVVIFTGAQAEPRSLSWGTNGNLFSISCNSDEVTELTASFSQLYAVSSGYSLLYNGPSYANGLNPTSGQNGVSGGQHFFCTSNGSMIYKRSLGTGSAISSVAIPSGITEMNSGILVDHCDNIYAGSSNAVVQFDSSFNVVNSIPVPGSVYCLAPGKNGDLLACGSDFIASLGLSICRSIYCDSITGLLPNAIFTAPNDICPGTCTNFLNLSANTNSCQWFFSGAVPSASIDFSPQNICYNTPGSYDVTLIATNTNGSDTLTLANYITVYPQPSPQGISQSGDTLFANPGAVSYQWFYNSTIIIGATNYFYVATASGNYNVIATDNNGCEVEAAIFDVIAGMLSPDSFRDADHGLLIVFPNPVRETLHVMSYPLTGTAVEISIYNMLEELVVPPLQTANCKLPTYSIDVSTLPPGLYYLEIHTARKTFRTRFIKQ